VVAVLLAYVYQSTASAVAFGTYSRICRLKSIRQQAVAISWMSRKCGCEPVVPVSEYEPRNGTWRGARRSQRQRQRADAGRVTIGLYSYYHQLKRFDLLLAHQQ